MDYKTRDEILDEMHESLQPLMDKYNLNSIGIYEEQGAEDHYYIGYSIEKNDDFFIINLPYVKNDNDELAVKEKNWTIQLEDHEERNFKTLDDVFLRIDEEIHH